MVNPKQPDRRRLLKGGAAIAGLAIGGRRLAMAQTPAVATPATNTTGAKPYSERSRFETAIRRPDGVGTRKTPLQDSMGIITPSEFFFGTQHGAPTPDIDPLEHRFMIHGMVDRPLVFTVEDLKRLPSVSRIHFIECHGNSSPTFHGGKDTASHADEVTVQETHGRTSCAEWTGTPLSLLLREVGVQKGASWLVAEGADQFKHAASIPLEKAMDDVLVVYGQNGEALRREQGYPLRLLVPGFEGIRNVKWLRRIKLGDEPFMTKLESAGYSRTRLSDGKSRWFQLEMGPKSVITRPSGGQQLAAPGFYEISGLAWSGAGAIRRVEVSTDGGRNWKNAVLQNPVLRMAHTRFRLPWTWDGEETVIQSRCFDEAGQTQPTLSEMSKVWGVDSNYWRSTTNIIGHFNPVHPWRVKRDGGIENALF